MLTRTINDNEDEDLEGMVRFQTPCSRFQVRVVMFKVRVVDFNCRVDIDECAAYSIVSTVVLLCPTARTYMSSAVCESLHVLCRYVQY